eukprot:9452494-Pyramimonas_sp.AAC.1
MANEDFLLYNFTVLLPYLHCDYRILPVFLPYVHRIYRIFHRTGQHWPTSGCKAISGASPPPVCLPRRGRTDWQKPSKPASDRSGIRACYTMPAMY